MYRHKKLQEEEEGQNREVKTEDESEGKERSGEEGESVTSSGVSQQEM